MRAAAKTFPPKSDVCGLKLDAGVNNAATAKGARRVGEIIDAASAILSRDGHAGLTLDSVAARVGIRKGNLQYYFPTRSHLLRTVFAQQIEQHTRDWLAAQGTPDTDPVDRLRRLVAFETQMNRDSDFVAQVRERCSLEGRDQGARELTSRWYAWVTEQYGGLIAEIRPDLDDKLCHQLAMIIYAMLVGSTPYFSANGPAPEECIGLERQMEGAILVLVREWR